MFARMVGFSRTIFRLFYYIILQYKAFGLSFLKKNSQIIEDFEILIIPTVSIARQQRNYFFAIKTCKIAKYYKSFTFQPLFHSG